MDTQEIAGIGASSSPIERNRAEAPETIPASTTTEVVEEVDLKAELERANNRVKKAEYTLRKLNMAAKEEAAEPQLDEERLNQLIDEKVEQRLEQKVAKLREDDTKNDVEELIANMSSDPDERELIRLNYKKRLVPTGFSRAEIMEDLEDARNMIRSKKLVKENKELNQALIAKSTTGQASIGSNLDRPTAEEDYKKNFTDRDLEMFKIAKVPEAKIKALAQQIRNAK